MAQGTSGKNINLKKVGGTVVDTNSGNKSAGTQRVVLATDQPTVPVSAASLPLPTGAATSALQSTQDTSINTLLKPASTLAAVTALGSITNALPAGTNLLGKVGIDQTTPGTTNKVTVGSDVVHTIIDSATLGTVTVASHAVTNAGTFAVQDSEKLADNAGFTDGTTKVLPVGYIFDEVAGTALTENDVAAARVDSKRAVVGVIEDATTRGQRLVVSATGAAKVDGSAVTQPVSLAVNTPVIAAGTNLMGKVGIDQTTPGTTNRVDVGTINSVAPAFGSGVRGATVQRVTIATDDVVPASQSGTWTVQPGNTANTTPWLITDTPSTTGGLSKFHLVGAATTNATNVKASAGQVYSITAFNVAATPAYLKFHNTAGTPTAGASVTDTYLIPGNTAGAGFVLNIDKGIAFSTGIGITITTGIADADTTAIAASNVVLNIYYK